MIEVARGAALSEPAGATGFTNTEIAEGDAVVGMRGLDLCREPDTLDRATGPRYYGFDIDYRPIEELLS